MTDSKKADLLSYARKKVGDLFKNFPVPAHGMDHINRVAQWAKQIARAEGADEFIAELSALLHDVGRINENKNDSSKIRHHELSYLLVKEWFEQDRKFDVLTADEKKVLLYAIHNHWDDTAEKYEVANILRDADKLDMYGKIGVQRAVEFHKIPDAITNNIKQNLLTAEHIKTKTAKMIIEQGNLLKPLQDWLIS